MIDSRFFAIDTTFNEVCLLCRALGSPTAPFCRGAIRERLCWSLRFSALSKKSLFHTLAGLNERIVAVCAAGLAAGPGVGLAVSLFVTWLGVVHHGLPLGSVATSMLRGGLVGAWLYPWRPKLAQHPLTGFRLTFCVSLLRSGLIFLLAPYSAAALHRTAEIGKAPVQGLGAALILAIVEQVRDRDEQSRAAALAELRTLQARMNPHFLFNALNALAALATVAPQEVPGATGRLRQFLRGSFDQQERVLVPLEEELAVVGAYSDIESLRFAGRLKVEHTIDLGLLNVLISPFLAPTAGRERDPTRAPILAPGRAAASRGPPCRKVARAER